jgi:hypothetical protein
MPSYDPEIDQFSGALYAILIEFVGAFLAPEAYQYFPYFAAAYTSVSLAVAKERTVRFPGQICRINPKKSRNRKAERPHIAPVRGGPTDHSRASAAPNR